jgi:hypothetical protein
VALAGGRDRLAASLAGMYLEPLNDGGLLIVATASPMPEDTEENRRRFLALNDALTPAFLSRSEVAPLKRPLLGYFSRD